MTFTIKSENLVKARYCEGWNMCLWGNPKLHIICGSCNGQFSTRKYYPFKSGGTVANCSFCGKWNILNIEYNK